MASNIRSASLPPGFELEENERDSFSALGPDLPEGFTLDVDQGDLLPGFELEQPAAPQPKLFPLTGGKTALGRQLYTTEAGELIGDRVVAITAPGLNGGKPTLVPLIHNGHILPEQEAIQRVIAAGGKDPETGKPLPFYETPDEALSAMEKLNSAKPAPVTAVQIPDAVGGEGGVARPQSLQIPAGPLSALPAQPLPDPMAQQEVATDPDQATWRDFIADITEAAKGLPGALKSAAASAWEGNNPEEIAKAKDWADRVINERRARSDANFTMEGADDVYVDLGPVRITRADVRNLPENVAFSLVSLLGGLVAGGAGAFIGGPVGGIAGMAGGSGVAAYRMDTNQVLRQLRDGLDRAALRDIGRPLTDDEWLSIAQSEDMQAAAYRLGVLWSRTANPAEEVRKHGLHEAGWEAVGNAALFAAGKALYQLGKSRNLLGAKAAGAFVGGSAMEVLTEAETHIGQAGVETRLGLREGREPEYLNLHDQYEAIREVAGPTLMLTGVMGAGAAGAGAAVRTVQDLNQARILRRELDQANLGDPEAIARDALTPKPIRGWDAQGRPVMEEVQSPAYTAEVQPTPWGDELPEGFHLVDPNQVAQVSADASDSPGAPPPPASSTQTGVSAESTAAAQPEPISNAALQADRQTIAELERLAAQASDPAVRQRLLRDAKILRDELEGENKVKLTPWERARRARHPSSNDDLITAIRKLGGIDTKRETDWEGRLSHLNKQNRAFGLPGIERPGSGLTLDEIAERLVELGFLENKDAHELEEKLWQAETGVKIYSRIVEGEIWERELQEALAARGEDVEPIDEVDEWDDILSAAWEDLQTSAAGMSSAQAGPRPPEEDGAFSDAFDVLRRVAAEIDEDAAENILERAAIADWGEQETARELLNVIRGSATSGTQDSQAAPGGDAGAEGPWRDAEGQPAGEGGGLPGIDQGDQGAPQSQGVVPLGGVERRADLTRRKRVSEMTPEEKDRELLTSRRTGLWNDRAYEEHDRLPIQVSIDLDGLKWLNDNLGHEAGDQLLRAMGDAMRAVTDRAYHISGDEFILQANTEEEARATVERINEIAARATITVELPDGSRITKKGVGFSYGIGQDLATAEAGLQQHKAERERAGLRSARGGEPAGVVRTPPAGEQDRGREAADVPATDEEEVARGPAVSIADRLKVRPERITSPTHRDLLSDAQDRDIVTKDDVRALFDAGEGVFGSGLHIPTEQQIAEQINALKVARMGKAAEQKAISKYEKEVSDLIDEAIELSAIGRTLSRVGVRKDAQAPAGVTTAGQKYNVAAAEYSNIVAAKLREAAKTAAFLEALKRRNPPAKQKAAPQSPAEQRPSGGDVLSQLSTISLDELEAMIDDVAGSADVPDTAKPARSRSKSGTSRSGTRAPRKTRSKPETTDTSNPAEVERTAGEIAKSLGYNLSSAGMEALKGLTELFGGPGKLNSGLTFNEETYAKAKPHFEAMLRDAIAAGKDLRDLIRAILNAFGTGVKPYIMRFAQDVQAGAVDLGNAAAQNQGTGRTETTTDESDQRGDANLERDRGDAGTGDRVGQEGVSAGHAGGRGGVRPGAQGTDGRGGRSGSGDRVPGRVPAAGGTQGDSPLSADQTGPEGGAAGSDDGERGGDVGLDGSPVESVATEAVAKAATKPLDLAEKIRLQKEADTKYRIIPADPKNIEDTLPALTEGQRGDVLFAERRFSTPDGYGVLFTNGTGTGKTFTGLGIVKRFAQQGKTNTIIVVPSDKIAADWIESGRILGLDIKMLESTRDAGNGVVITTYANFGQNNTLIGRMWDLIVADESHYLMSGKDRAETNALRTLRAISMHSRLGGSRRGYAATEKEREELERVRKQISANIKIINRDDTMWDIANALRQENEKLEARAEELQSIIDARYRAEQALVEQYQGEKRPRVVFLSATPFSYEKTVDYAEEYLFTYEADQGGRGYNSGSPFDRFMMQHFGYRMRNNKLTAPGPEVDRGLLQRQFNAWLKKNSVLSSRLIDVPFDYDRKFVLVESDIGAKIDAALDDLRNDRRLRPLAPHILEKFDHLGRRYLLEAIKAREVIPMIREHLALGRKVVVFHDFKKGGGFNPFDVRYLTKSTEEVTLYSETGEATKTKIADIARLFIDAHRELVEWPLASLPSPIETFKREFGEDELVIFNGDIPKSERREAVRKFQDDNSKVKIILVQSAAGREGISLHDTTGKHQRVLFNLGLPTTPATAIQQEGRIYRIGQQSDAIFRYLNTGTNWERLAFADTIARRASAVENLAQGEEARALMDAFIQGFEESDRYPAGAEGEGKGGKERDRAAMAALSEWDRAKTLYFSQQKKTSRNKAAEGIDYFATPEPVGLKMVELADIRGGEDVLEPSAGHGAIARWFPENARRTVIEPSTELYSRLRIATDAKALQERFEDHNIVNKYDAIVMNPPFGHGGKTAIEHLAKAAKHLRDRGRIVALIPTGPAADKRFDDWMYGTDAKGKKADPSSDGMYLVADIKLPPVTFERAGTRVSTRIVVLEKVMDREEAAKLGPEATRDYSDIQTIGELFDRLEGLELKPRRRLSQQPGSETLTTGPQAGGGARAATEAGGIPFTLAQTRHAKKGIDLYVATFSARVPREVYDRVNSIAKKHGGYYSSYNKQGAIPGFQFESEADRAAFLAEVNGESVQEERAGYGVDLPQTIDVDGVQRPTSNSEGQPIAATEEAVRNFWRWFRDSKVVDDEGRPLVVYHGSEQEFDEFKPGDRFGYYFTENKAVANQYGEVREYYLASQKHLDLTTEEGLKVVDEIASRFDPEDIVDSQGDQVSLREIVEYGDWSGGGALQDRFLREVQKRGYTGVTMEDFHGGGQNETAIVVFDPRQIKSATGNRGTFDPADPRTLLQRSRITQATYEDRIDELFRDENPRRIGAVSRSSTVSAEAVESVREAVRAQLRGIDGVAWDVVPTEADLPEGLRKAIEQEGAAGQVTAAYHEGAIYYVAERLSDPLAVEVATLHELDGHVGFERIFGSEATKAGNDLYMRMGGMDGIRRLADQYGIDFAPYIETAKGIDDLSRRRAYLVNELLAHLQEVRAVESLPARIKRALQTYWGAIRQWLREHGFTVVGTEFTDSDLAYLLRSMSRAARGQGKTIIYREPTEAWFQRKRQPPLVQLSLPNTATIQPMDILRPIGQPAASRKVAGTDLGPFLDRLNSEADAKELFARTVKQFEDRFTDARRGKVSWKETEEMARSLGWTGDKLMERRRGQAFNAEEWEAARTIVDKAMSEVLEAAQRAANGGTDQDLVLFRQRLSKFVPLAEQVMGARAEWGRLGSIMRKQASQAKAVAEILDAMGGRMTIEMQAKAIADVAASGASPETVRKTMVKVAKVRFIDKIIEIWINGLLSGPQTHAVNIASNQLIALLSIPEHAVAALVGKLHGGGDKVYMREILPRAWGLLSGARDGALLGAQVFSSTAKRYHLAKTQAMREGLTGAALKARTRELVEKARKLSGDRPENLSAEEAIVWDIHEQSQTLEEGTDFFEKVDTGYRKAIGGVSGRFIRTPGNFLQSQDEFYKAIAFRMDLNARAMRQAIREGLKGPELYERASEIARKVDALRGLDRPAMLATPEEEMLWNMRDELMHFARYQTFTNPLGPLGRTMQAIATRWPVFRFIVPFIRTPVNIVKFAGHRSPVAPLMRSFREEWAKGGAARDVAVARMVVGTGIGMAVMMLAMQGIITGGGPTDPNKRRVWLQKYRPYSIKIGDTWYSYGRLEPLGMIMGVSADLASVFHVMDEADAEEVAGLLYASVVKNLASKTFLQGISNAVAAYYDPDRYGEAWLTQFAGTAIPTGIAQVARVQDPTLRRAETIIEKWKSRIPGLSDDLLPRRDIFGQPIVLGGGWGPDIISPVYIGLDPHDPVVDEMIRLGVTVSPPRKQIGRVELTPEQYDQYAELSGTLAKKMLDQFVAQPSYNQIPDAMRQEMIEKFFNAAREQARVMLFTQYPEIIRQQTQKKVEEMREGLGQ